MSVRRKATRIALTGIAPLALTALTASPAVAHGSMSDPVSRVSACFAEGPENPKSAACKAAVRVGGTQALYDWNGVRDGNAGGKSKERIPDGKLCSAGDTTYKGLDLPRADWPSSAMRAGHHTFRYRATAPHKGSFELYITKEGYDPAKPLKWSDLEPEPFAKVTDPALKGGEYVFDGKVPERSGRHLIYSIWQRSDSPEAFYTCSDVDMGGKTAEKTKKDQAPAPAAGAPTEEQITKGADRSTVDHHHGRGGDHHGNGPSHGHGGAPEGKHAQAESTPVRPANAPAAQGESLARTGGDSSTAALAVGGAAVLATGSALLFVAARRRAARSRA
ncbi:lytic polysaccharide monooxygenase [Streptomyces sp. NPDC001339]|uniref:lytic polysaccharide monooxygenase auxiliary activity family 9 protein n=1 Tax=Streptomyces sp. NPDC001339 TaxID=3364563 RepID=UPI00367CFD8C